MLHLHAIKLFYRKFTSVQMQFIIPHIMAFYLLSAVTLLLSSVNMKIRLWKARLIFVYFPQLYLIVAGSIK
jgi:hypothetical protein